MGQYPVCIRVGAIPSAGVTTRSSGRGQEPDCVGIALVLFQPGYYDVSRGANTEGALQRCQPGVSVDGGLGDIERFGFTILGATGAICREELRDCEGPVGRIRHRVRREDGVAASYTAARDWIGGACGGIACGAAGVRHN